MSNFQANHDFVHLPELVVSLALFLPRHKLSQAALEPGEADSFLLLDFF